MRTPRWFYSKVLASNTCGFETTERSTPKRARVPRRDRRRSLLQSSALALLFLLILGAAFAIPSNSIPYIDFVSPVSINPGATGVTLTIDGANLAPTSVVNWNGIPLTTSFVSTKQLTAVVPDSFVVAIGTASITVVSPAPGGGTSNVVFVPVAAAEALINFPASPSSSVSVGTLPQGLAVADFNGDGKQDMAIANKTDGTVSILLGNGDGTFTAAAPLTAFPGGGANWVVAGDFNGDGKLDLAVANLSTNGTVTGGVSIFLGNGNGTFGAATSVQVGNGPFAIVAGDFNRDGKLDLAVSNSVAGTVTILLGNGNGTFTPQAPISVGSGASSDPSVIVAGDFNQDGILDLAVSNQADSTVSILLGAGNGTFSVQPPISTGGSGQPIGLIVADFNRDGIPDLAAVNVTDVAIMIGNGSGGFTVTNTPTLTGSNLITGVAGDFNGDGKIDLLISDSNLGQVFLLPGNGNGTFGAATAFPTAAGAFGTATADFNGDGGLDLAITNGGATSVSIFLQLLPVGLAPTSLAFGNQNVASTSASQTVTLTNGSAVNLDIANVGFTGADPPDFAIPASNCIPAVPSHGTCTITITFAPTAAGARSAVLTVTDDASTSPQSINVTGTGVSTAAVTLSAPSLTFTSQAVATTSAPQTVTLTNSGAGSLSITSIISTGANSGDFLESDNCPTSLAGSAVCTISVRFSPTAINTRNASVTITDGASNSPQSITLTGAAVQGTPTITWANPAAITFGTPLSATQLNATASVAGTFVYSPPATTILAASSQPLSVTFTPTDTTDFTNATANATIMVNKATPTITWANPAAITFGTALSATQLDATASTPGTFVYVPAAGTVLAAGSQSLAVTFTPTDAVDFNNATANATIVVNKATPTITWANPAAITFGTALSATQLDATASTAGTFIYVPAAGTVLAAGSQSLAVTFTPTDAADFTNATANATVVVNKATPIITWANPASITFGTALSATQLNATASTAGTFVYTPAAGVVLGAGSQSLSVAFTPTDAADFNNATATATIVVNKATPIITWANPAAIVFGTPLGATQLNATANTPGTFVYVPAAGAVLGFGSQSLAVTFTPTDAVDFATATANATIVVNKATPIITWANPAAITFGTPLSAAQLNATASTAGTFVYNPAAGTILAAGSQILSVAFSPTDAVDFNNAIASVTIIVNKATPVITWANPAAITFGTALSATQLNATASTAGTFVYTPAAGSVPAAGSQILSVAFTPTDAVDFNNATATATLVVNKAVPVITWANPAGIVFGTALSATQLDATASTAGTFIYTPAAGTIPQGGSQTLSVAFTATDAADFTTASANVTIVVSKAAPLVTWTTPAAITFGTPLGAAQLDATANTAGTFVYTPAAGTVLAVGSQPLSVAFTATNPADFSGGAANVTILVNPAASATALTASLLQAAPAESVTFTAKVTSAGGVPTGTVNFLDGATLLGSATLNAGTATFSASFTVIGTHPITAVYVASANFTASTSSALSEVIALADFVLTDTGVASVTAKAGRAVLVPLSFTAQGDFTGAVVLSINGLPPSTTATFVPASVSLSGNTVPDSLTLTTSARFGFLAQSHDSSSRMLFASAMSLPLVGMVLGGVAMSGKGRRKRWAMLLFVLLIGVGAIGGCAVTNSQNNEKLGTPAGTYNMTITGTSGATQHSIPFTLVVE
jgi:hypothetical protein